VGQDAGGDEMKIWDWVERGLGIGDVITVSPDPGDSCMKCGGPLSNTMTGRVSLVSENRVEIRVDNPPSCPHCGDVLGRAVFRRGLSFPFHVRATAINERR
jgi:hypothetical protein